MLRTQIFMDIAMQPSYHAVWLKKINEIVNQKVDGNYRRHTTRYHSRFLLLEIYWMYLWYLFYPVKLLSNDTLWRMDGPRVNQQFFLTDRTNIYERKNILSPGFICHFIGTLTILAYILWQQRRILQQGISLKREYSIL